jgi:hypothetical protein
MPPACQHIAFSTEEDFVTHGLDPADGNVILSDGDLLSVGPDDAGQVRCWICARNADLLASTFDVSVDIGLDAVDVLDAEAYLVAFSTELNSPNVGQFTAGDLLITNGTILPNQALTARWQAGYDLGLDAIHVVGEPEAIRAFIDAAANYGRDAWLQDPGLLSGLLREYGVDLWFSTEGTLGPVEAPKFLDGDLLSAATGTIVAGNDVLLPPGVPAGIPARGVDFGLDAVTAERAGTRQSIHYSTEILYQGQLTFTDGDVLLAGNGIAASHQQWIQCFAPKANFVGLDAFHATLIIPPPKYVLYLPIVLRDR